MGDSSFRRHGLHTGPFARRAKVPWKECNQMDERLKLIARLLDGEKMAVLCRQFGISRKTGYKILTRYNEIGLEGLTDRSRRPYRHANQLPIQIETHIVRLKQDKPSWGAPKIREKLARLYRGLPEIDYPFHDRTATVTTCGRICFNRQKINLSVVFAGQSVGIKQVSEQTWLVSFMDYDLGYFDHETCRLEPIENPFGPKILHPPPDPHLTPTGAKPPARAPHIAP